MDKVGQQGLTMSIDERAAELNSLSLRAKASEKEAEIVKEALDIIDNRRYSYLYQLLKTRGW